MSKVFNIIGGNYSNVSSNRIHVVICLSFKLGHK